jgi:hypothetical protein
MYTESTLEVVLAAVACVASVVVLYLAMALLVI